MIILNKKKYFLLILFWTVPYSSFSGQFFKLSLTQYVDLSLNISSQAQVLADTVIYSEMDISSAQHQFSPKLIPLANIGYNSTNSNQTLGLKLNKKMETGQDLTFGLTGDRIDSDEYVVTNSHSVRTYVQISQSLFRKWGKKYNRVALTRAEKLKRKQELLNILTRQELILSSMQKYYAAVRAELQCQKSKTTLKRAQKYLDIAKSRFSVDLVSKADVYRAELTLLDAQNNDLEQQQQRSKAFDDLREQVNWFFDDEFRLEKDIKLLVPVIPKDYDEHLLTNHPAWQALRIDQELQQLAIYSAQRNLLPDLSLNVRGEQKGQGNSFNEARERDETTWSISLQLNSTFDHFNERSALTREKMAAAKLRRKAESLKRRIRRDARQAFEDLQAEERRLNISLKRFDQAEQALDLALTRYERGLSDNLELLTAEADYAAAESGIEESRISYNLSAVRLGQALGVLDMDWLAMSLNREQIN